MSTNYYGLRAPFTAIGVIPNGPDVRMVYLEVAGKHFWGGVCTREALSRDHDDAIEATSVVVPPVVASRPAIGSGALDDALGLREETPVVVVPAESAGGAE